MVAWVNKSDDDENAVVVAISNFVPPNSADVPYLRLSVGDVIDVKKSSNDWYYGVLRTDTNKAGIFPKSYVTVKACGGTDRTSGSSTASCSSSSTNSVFAPIVAETGLILHQWMSIARQLYAKRNSIEVTPLTTMMKDLMNWRKKVIREKLPAEDIQNLKQKMSKTIDVGNKKLDLDLVIRDENGNVLDPDSFKVLELYEHHCSAAERIHNESRRSMNSANSRRNQGSWCLLTTLSDFLIRLPTDVEVFLALYDAQNHQYISEFFTAYLPVQSDITPNGTIVTRRPSTNGAFTNVKVLYTDFGNKDMERRKVFLVCRVIKFGPFDSTSLPRKLSPTNTCVRQTYAVGALDVSEVFSSSLYAADQDSPNDDQETQAFMQLHVCESKYEETLQKILEGRSTVTLVGANANSMNNVGADLRDQVVWLSVQRLWGNADELLTHPSILPNVPVVIRKIGFPEVISKEDVRNDMYVTLVGGDFKESGKERNIEVKVALVTESGDVFPDSFVSVGIVTKKDATFTSTVYQHEHRPRWNDIFKLAIPIDKYDELHLRFTFKHRSSNESKDKEQKPFAVSYVRLIQTNGTILMDGEYDLNVYKTEKRFDDASVTYLQLPATKLDLEKLYAASGNNNNYHSSTKISSQNGNFVLCPKDTFHIRTVVCSMSLTQNVELLGLLEWKSKREYLKTSLQTLMKHDNDKIGAEIVKFLQDILDVLFNILTSTNDYDQLAFDALVYVIGLVDEKRFHSFKPVMDTYLQQIFSAVLVHEKLINILNKYICNVEKHANQLFSALKSLEYLIKFVVRSRVLFMTTQDNENDGDRRKSFLALIRQIPLSLAKLFESTNERSNLKCQGAALKYIPSTVGDIMTVFDAEELANLLVVMLNKVPTGSLTNQKLVYVRQLVISPIFLRPDCRRRLLPDFLKTVKKSMENNEELELCLLILSDIMKVLYPREPKCETESDDLKIIVKIILRPIMQLIIRLPDLKPIKIENLPSALIPRYVALLTSVLDQMSASACRDYVREFQQNTDLMDFVVELLMLLKDLVERLVFPNDWFQMISLQNSVFLKILGFMAMIIRQRFSDPFVFSAYENFFLTSVAFITQKHLQLELFAPIKRQTMLKRFHDMRFSCAKEIRNTWFHMNMMKKAEFIPSLVGPILLVTLIPQIEVRQTTIPIFLDMIITGLYYKPRTDENGKLTVNHSKFVEFERELISKLDSFVDAGKGDDEYTESFSTIMKKHLLCHKNDTTKHAGIRLTTMVERLMRRLLEYRDVKLNHNCVDNCMTCVYNLLEFYRENEQIELYVRYLYKLYDLHMSCENFVEAAATLKLHADQLQWSNDHVPLELRGQESFRAADGSNEMEAMTERRMKENLYYEIIALYDRGSLWEKAIEVCKELQELYEKTTCEYEKLSALLEKMARMYKNIMTEQRAEPEYFRVGFYGRGFPTFLQNPNKFIYRGQPYERLVDFCTRMEAQFPRASVLQTLAPPSDELLKSNEQYLQIQKVDSVASDLNKPTTSDQISSKIAWYYKFNEVQKFISSRRLPNRKSQSNTNVVASNDVEKEILMWWEQTIVVTSYKFPGILRCFPITAFETTELSPLQVAIDTMKNSTRILTQCVEDCEEFGEKFVSPLAMKLQGILKPAVQGGIANYEKTFFADSFVSKCNAKELKEIEEIKELIASQIPILEKGLFVHAKYCTEDQRNFHSFLIGCFDEYKTHVETNYGKKPSLLPPDATLHIVRPRTLTKHMSVDNVLDNSFGTLPRKSAKTDTNSSSVLHFTTIRNVSMVGTVPRRTQNKRKPSQTGHSFNERDTTPTVKRLSNTSIGSSHSSDSIQGLKNGSIVEIGETITPQRPLRPPSTPSSAKQLSLRLVRDRNPSSTFHVSLGSVEDNLDALDDNFDSISPPVILNSPAPPLLEQAPPLPPRRSNSNEISSRPSTSSVAVTSPRIVPSPRIRDLENNFVLPRKDKPLPPRPE